MGTRNKLSGPQVCSLQCKGCNTLHLSSLGVLTNLSSRSVAREFVLLETKRWGCVLGDVSLRALGGKQCLSWDVCEKPRQGDPGPKVCLKLAVGL